MNPVKDLNELAQAACLNARRKGWWPGLPVHNPGEGTDPMYEMDPAERIEAACVNQEFPQKVALIHSEASELLEDYRRTANPVDLVKIHRDANGKPIGVPIEIADIIIRCLDLSEALGVNIQQAVNEKMAYNTTRPERHGGKRC